MEGKADIRVGFFLSHGVLLMEEREGIKPPLTEPSPRPFLLICW